ncbi:hypothetical protein H072_93 [Dactylellina haptotyla CBS 200.50]|uniref:Uncharacterized protein n=1 Tax=Dactylellina haptotyla (strain CBS 200.50) TaxID=1284197 RepID=S8AST7_DACHA|nr:hypothetical protein H072_93 [Dactylellina haptotyla CBS 200.50]
MDHHEPWDPTGNYNFPPQQHVSSQPTATTQNPEQAAPETPSTRPTRPTYTPSTSTSSIPQYHAGSGDHSHLPRINRRPVGGSKTPSEESNSPTGTEETGTGTTDSRQRSGTPADEEHYEGYYDYPSHYGSSDFGASSNLFPSREAAPVRISSPAFDSAGNPQSPDDADPERGRVGIAAIAAGVIGAGAVIQGNITQNSGGQPGFLQPAYGGGDVIRKPTMARRLFDRGSSTLQRMKTGAANRKTGETGTYAKLGDGEEDEDAEYGAGFDVSSYDSFPSFNDDKASKTSYGSRGIELRGLKHQGSAFDLSDHEHSFSLRSGGTFHGQDLAIPVDLDPPNWRPWEMDWPYLTFLNVLTFALAGLTEYLIQLSDSIGTKGLIQYQSARNVPIDQWIAWKYVPTVVGVIFGVLWQVTDTEVKRNEPYYQMSKPNGAIAKYSLNVDYFEFLSFLTPFQGVRYRQWAVSCSAMCYFLSYAIIPNLLGSLLDTEDFTQQELDANKKIGNLNEKYLRVDNRYARPLEAMFVLVGLFGVCLQVLLIRRKSGLVGDVSGIAGIAAMANKSHILMDFKGLDEADERQIHEHLSKRRYRLHKMSLYLGADVAMAERPEFHESKRKKIKKESPNHPIFTLFTAIPLALFFVAILAIMPILSFTSSGKSFIQKVPFTAIFLGVVIKSIWEVLDKQLRIIQPFRSLNEGNSRPNILTLDYTGTIPGWVTVKAIQNRHWLLALVTFDSVLIEVFTVTTGSFLNRSASDEETDTSIRVSFSLATAITSILLATLFLVIQRRRKPFLPRQPGTIASVLTFIHQSKMVTDFEKMEDWPTYKREAKLMEINKRYAFGWFSGRDKEIHLGIDQCPISSKYEYGKDYKKGVVGTVGDYEYY